MTRPDNLIRRWLGHGPSNKQKLRQPLLWAIFSEESCPERKQRPSFKLDRRHSATMIECAASHRSFLLAQSQD